MIVDYPCLTDLLWIPKGKRNPRPYAWVDKVPVEILELVEDEAPLVASVKSGDLFDKDKPPVLYRKHGDSWLRAVEGAETVQDILADPTVLGLCDKQADYGIRRAYGGKHDPRGGDWLIAEGPTKVLESRTSLPEGRECVLPTHVDLTNGRRDDILLGARKIVIVGGVVFTRTLEPILSVDSHHSMRHDGFTFKVVEEDPASRGIHHRLDALDGLVASFREKKDTYVTAPDVRVFRPDLLDFDPLPHAVLKASVALVKRAADRISHATPRYMMAYARLRDALFDEVPYSLDNVDPEEVVPKASTEELRDLLVEACEAGVDSIGLEEVRSYEYRNPVSTVLDQLEGTDLHGVFERRFRHVFPRLDGKMVEGSEPEDDVPEEDLVVLSVPRP